MPYIPPEVVAKAREMDLLTYLRNYEPQELVHFGGSTYCTREHDSLKISNGKWCWFSRGIGGTSALDYLIKVKEIPFMEAVERIMGQTAAQPPVFVSAPKQEKPKELLLPRASRGVAHAMSYLIGRGIDRELIDFCIRTGRLYESEPYHNVVFIGQDQTGKARYANLRGIGTDFIGDAGGSDKRYSFAIPAAATSGTVHLFESAIDLLSYGTLLKMEGMDWRRNHLLSLAGVYKPRKRIEDSTLPAALGQYLSDHPQIRNMGALYDHDQQVIFVRRGMDAPNIFRSVSMELAHAEIGAAREDYTRDSAAFPAYCASYMLCRKNGVDVRGYDFGSLPESLRESDPQTQRAALSEIRDTAAGISARMSRVLEQNKAPKSKEQER